MHGDDELDLAGAGGMGGPAGGGNSEIALWVASTFTPVTVDGVTLYDLTNPLT